MFGVQKFVFNLFLFTTVLNLKFLNANYFKKTPEDLYYKYDDQPIRAPNLTIAVIYKFTKNNSEVNIESAGNIITMICELDNYNSGTGEFPVEGDFNLLLYPTIDEDDFSQWSLTRQVFGQNLFFSGTNKTFGAIQDTQIDAIIRQTNLKEFTYESPITSGVSLPSINFVSSRLSYKSYNDPLLVEPSSSYTGSVIISQPSSQLLANFITQILNHYNWTLIGSVFSSDIIGYYGQLNLQDWVYTYSKNLIFSCVGVFNITADKNAAISNLNDFTSCLTSSNKIRAVVVWMDAEDAIRASEEILNIVGKSSNLVFIYPGLSDSLATKSAPESSMFLRPNLNYERPDKEFKCSQVSKDTVLKLLGKETVDMVTRFYGKCVVTDPSLPPCDDIRTDDNSDCTCTDDKAVLKLFYYQKYFYLHPSLYLHVVIIFIFFG